MLMSVSGESGLVGQVARCQNQHLQHHREQAKSAGRDHHMVFFIVLKQKTWRLPAVMTPKTDLRSVLVKLSFLQSCVYNWKLFSASYFMSLYHHISVNRYGEKRLAVYDILLLLTS